MSNNTCQTLIDQSLFADGILPDDPSIARSAETKEALRPAHVLLDMVQNNPGEDPFVTHYNDPVFLKKLGYQGKVYELFEAAQFAIDWSPIDPDIFPAGSPERAWVDQKAAELDQFYNATKQAGLSIYCHTDMIVFPARLVEKYKLTNFKQIADPDTRKYLRAAVQQMFSRFPQLDGLVVRIGETYLHGSPYHIGDIEDRMNPHKTIVPLMQMLREEVCEKLNKKVFFRSWDSFDESIPDYLAVSDGVAPHPNLTIVVKHCEDDFHRGNPFSRILGVGRHSQIVEVQCQREYEGKGAYPNYIAHGVIEGFEEHPGQSVRKIWANPLITGMFTWSRGGGWNGPYITNELWCDLNVYVLSHWAQNPSRSEESIFRQYCSSVLKLSIGDTSKFRRLCLLSADAVYRGIRGIHNEITPWWTRDKYMSPPPLPVQADLIPEFLAQKEDAVRLWQEILALAKEIRFSDLATQDYVEVSCQYGLDVYQIYRAAFHLAALGTDGDKAQIREILADYDQTWERFHALKAAHASCATLYEDKGFRDEPSLKTMIEEFRKAVA